MRLVEDQRCCEGLRRSAERQRQIARLEERLSHGMIIRPSGDVLGWVLTGGG